MAYVVASYDISSDAHYGPRGSDDRAFIALFNDKEKAIQHIIKEIEELMMKGVTQR